VAFSLDCASKKYLNGGFIGRYLLQDLMCGLIARKYMSSNQYKMGMGGMGRSRKNRKCVKWNIHEIN
jgi:hypothetical protein